MRSARFFADYLFFMAWVIVDESIDIKRDAQRADQKFVTSKLSLHLAVSINIAALITNVNKPKVRRIAGSVNNLISEPIRPLIKPKRSATQR
jgi:hypothetical protein